MGAMNSIRSRSGFASGSVGRSASVSVGSGTAKMAMKAITATTC